MVTQNNLLIFGMKQCFYFAQKKTAGHEAGGKEVSQYLMDWKNFWGNIKLIGQDHLVDDMDNAVAGHHVDRSHGRTVYSHGAVFKEDINILAIDRRC